VPTFQAKAEWGYLLLLLWSHDGSAPGDEEFSISAFLCAADKSRGHMGEMLGKGKQLILDHKVEVKGREVY